MCRRFWTASRLVSIEREQKSDVSQKYAAGCSTQPLGHVFLYAIAARFRFGSQTENGGRNDDIFLGEDTPQRPSQNGAV